MSNLEETFEKWLAADLADKEAKKAAENKAAEPKYVTAEQLQEAMKAFAADLGTSIAEQVESVKASVAEEVEKALPVRGEGAGRVGAQPSGEQNEDPIEYLVKKGRTDEGWDERDKELVTAIVVGAMKQGWN